MNFEKLADAINDSARHVAGLTVTYLLVGSYFAVSIISVADQELLLRSKLSLPVLNVGVPLYQFFVVAPLFLLALHLNLLLQQRFLSSKLGTWLSLDMGSECTTFPLVGHREHIEVARISGRFFSAIALHMMLPPMSRCIRFLVGASFFLVVAVFPLAVLLAAEWRLLALNNDHMEAYYRVLVVIDLILLWYFIPVMLSLGGGWRCWCNLRSDLGRREYWRFVLKRLCMLLLSSATLFFSIWTLDVGSECVRGGSVHTWSKFWHTIAGGPEWLSRIGFSPHLSLRGRDLALEGPPAELVAAYYADGRKPEEAWLEYGKGVNLAGLNLRCADFSEARMIGVNFAGADLSGANLVGADLRLAVFSPELNLGVEGQEPFLAGGDREKRLKLGAANLSGANLHGADLRGSSLLLAELEGTDLTEARFDSADLRGADLKEAKAVRASFVGADLTLAKLPVADLEQADLRGAKLERAALPGASLLRACLTAVDLSRSRLFAAHVVEAKLEAADLEGAEVLGADFRGAWLVGTGGLELRGVDLRWAKLHGSCDENGRGPDLVDLRMADFEPPKTFTASPCGPTGRTSRTQESEIRDEANGESYWDQLLDELESALQGAGAVRRQEMRRLVKRARSRDSSKCWAKIPATTEGKVGPVDQESRFVLILEEQLAARQLSGWPNLASSEEAAYMGRLSGLLAQRSVEDKSYLEPVREVIRGERAPRTPELEEALGRVLLSASSDGDDGP